MLLALRVASDRYILECLSNYTLRWCSGGRAPIPVRVHLKSEMDLDLVMRGSHPEEATEQKPEGESVNTS